MNVIKESHDSILRRKNLDQEKRRILSMDFKKKSDKADWDRLNKFLQERQSQITTQGASQNNDVMAAEGDASFQLQLDNTPQSQWSYPQNMREQIE